MKSFSLSLLPAILFCSVLSVHSSPSGCMEKWIKEQQKTDTSLLNKYAITVQEDWTYPGFANIYFTSHTILLNQQFESISRGWFSSKALPPVGDEIHHESHACHCDDFFTGYKIWHETKVVCSTI